MRQTYDYEDHSGGLPLIYMALAVSVFVLMVLVLVVAMNKDKGSGQGYTSVLQEEIHIYRAVRADAVCQCGGVFFRDDTFLYNDVF